MIDHAILPSIVRATLPQSYQAAKNALMQCDRVDECHAWADKALALASYAKQSKDTLLERMAKRIRSRAIRRCGELLKLIEKGKTGPKLRDGADPQLGRTSAADAAGLSERDRKTALRVANVDPELFEQQVESEHPPTVTQLAAQGTKPKPLTQMNGRDPRDFKEATQVMGSVEDFVREMRKFDFSKAARGMSDTERKKCHRLVIELDSLMDKLAVTLQGD